MRRIICCSFLLLGLIVIPVFGRADTIGLNKALDGTSPYVMPFGRGDIIGPNGDTLNLALNSVTNTGDGTNTYVTHFGRADTIGPNGDTLNLALNSVTNNGDGTSAYVMHRYRGTEGFEWKKWGDQRHRRDPRRDPTDPVSVPEPSSALLLIPSLLGTIFAFRRRL